MSFSQVLEVLVGLAVAYYVLGLVVSFFSSRILEVYETRGAILEDYLKAIVGDAEVENLLKVPQIESLIPLRYKKWYSILTNGLKKSPAKTKPGKESTGADLVEKKMIEKIPAKDLVSGVFDLFGLLDENIEEAIKGSDEIQNILHFIDRLPDCETKKQLLAMYGRGVQDLEGMRKRIESWYSGLMDQAAATYKAHARRVVILLSLVITLVTGFDTIEYAQDLLANQDRQAVAAALADEFVANEGSDAELQPLLEKIDALNAGLGWTAMVDNLPGEDADSGEWAAFVGLKVAGLFITTAAVSQGSSFWYDVLKKATAAQPAKPAEEKDE